MNNWNITGNLGRDAELKYLPSGEALISMNVAVKAGFGKNEQTVWVNATLWGKRAESDVIDFLKKGQLVGINGELSLSEWEDKDGNKRTSVKLRVGGLDLLGKRDEGDGTAPAPKQAEKPADDFIDSDVPF